MVNVIDIDKTIEYSLKADKGDDKTMFILGMIDPFAAGVIASQVRGTNRSVKTADENAMAFNVALVRHGLKGWKNLHRIDGSEVEFTSETVELPLVGTCTVASDRSIKMLRLPWLMELAAKMAWAEDGKR